MSTLSTTWVQVCIMHDPVMPLQLAFAYLLTALVLLHGSTHIMLAHSFIRLVLSSTCALQMAQEQLQQQLSGAKAACKASDSRCAQMQAQHQVQLNELTQHLQAAKQHTEDLAQQHQQALADQLASATAATAAEHNQEVAQLQNQYTECLSSQATAVAQLQREVAATAAQAEDDMAAVGQQLSAMLQGNRHSQVDLREQLQQLQLEVAAVREP